MGRKGERTGRRGGGGSVEQKGRDEKTISPAQHDKCHTHTQVPADSECERLTVEVCESADTGADAR